jgi:hypothetical protein
MRKVFSVALLTALASIFVLTQSALASVTIDLEWVDSGTPTLTIDPGDTAGGGNRNMLVIMSYSTNLVGASTSVQYSSGSGLAFQGATTWTGVFIRMMTPSNTFHPTGGVADTGTELSSFASIVDPTSPQPSAPPGVNYVIGTILWNTAGTVAGTETLSAIIAFGLDGFLNGNFNNIDAAVIAAGGLRGATLNIIPEPGTVSLLGLGLVGLILAGRRRRA